MEKKTVATAASFFLLCVIVGTALYFVIAPRYSSDRTTATDPVLALKRRVVGRDVKSRIRFGDTLFGLYSTHLVVVDDDLLLFRDSLFRDAPEGFKSNMEVPRNGLSWLISITRRYGIPFTIETAQSLIGDDGRHGTVHSITDQVQPPPHAGHDDARAFFAPPAIKPSGVFGGNGELNGFIVLLIVALIELMLFGLIPAKHTTFSAPKKLIHAHLMHERAFRNSNDLGLVFMNIYVKELITNVANGVVSRYTENARDLHFFYDGNHVTVFDPQDAKNT